MSCITLEPSILAQGAIAALPQPQTAQALQALFGTRQSPQRERDGRRT
jgi:hypothetical protein